MSETVICGWQAIANMFGISKRNMTRRRVELLEAGAIFYMKRGTPPRKVVCAWPSVLKAWTIQKSVRNENV